MSPLSVRPKCHIHGPCSSGTFLDVEFDDALCFASDFWPPSALAWINRCQSWPSPHIVDDIVRNGCHFAAIGHKLGNHEENEWRILFSLAEQKLVYTMNHIQFLTYGLLKLILKEVIKERIEESLLCSYHMKTAVFWALQQNSIPHWYPQNFLECFWVCFKLLLKWVYEGVCPNFFIPENNMFLTNIFGESQRKLFLELHGLYEKGIALLLHSQSIRSIIIIGLCNPGLCMYNSEDDEEIVFNLNLFIELRSNNPMFIPTLNSWFEFPKIMETLMNEEPTNYQVLGQCDEHLAEVALNDLQIYVKHGPIHPFLKIYVGRSEEFVSSSRETFPKTALYSYLQSLRQYPLNELENVTLRKIHDIL
ncbi:uncharacterized protein LOC134249559 [Saccostrea cucullata]|uniref:uncharacterized protein LOC134249559 n=1 Tax=Saccostrea cuccullata TaxID=36930 RepID=UPI002ED5623F